MADTPVPAQSFFDRNFGIRNQDLEKVIDAALGKKADYADLFFEYRRNEGVSLEEGMVKNCSQSTSNGVGVRVLAETKTGYAYTDDITIENLEIAARTAQYIAQSRPAQLPAQIGQRPGADHDLYAIKTPVNDVPLDKKVSLLYEIDKFTRALDPRVKNVFASIGIEQKVILVVTSSGVVVGDVQPLVRLSVTCIAEENGKRQHGTAGGGGRVEFSFLTEDDRWQHWVDDRGRAGAAQPQRRRRAGRRDDRRARPRLAGRAAARGGRPRPRGRLQPQGDLGVQRPHRPAGRLAAVHRGRRRHDRQPPRLAQLRRRGHADRPHGADRERHPARLSAGPPQRPADGHAADRQRPARELRPHDDAAHDQHVHAGRRVGAGGHRPLGAEGPLRRLVRRRPGRHHQRQVRLLRHRGLPDRGRQDHDAGQGRDADRQRAGRADRVSMVGNDLALDEGIGTCGKDGQSVPVGVGMPTIKIDR